ncbi:MAG TPA: 3' terminal RNA ribose 2'-O-methyltransferase Hen1 [Anaerolineales bacterium]|nr:3' terminal RNA ribose 2'-O-methyltransferase Hen1 [Anaerolineales bacterium]HLO28950.1 3' terminal RNA ribose 2'-O-methyltransferase Hen1 [Anaerolineales bacterium]
MLLTITSTTYPATDLGYLLHKNPARVQTFELKFGKAHVFYPEASAGKCTAALLLDIDPVHLVRGQRGTLEQYVNDRPYVASSFMSVVLAQVYGSALNGQSKERQALSETALPFSAKLAVVQCRGGESILRRLFEPIGYTVTAEPYPLDEQHPEWGQSDYFTVTLAGTLRLRDLLTHLYVLLPVMDDEKHYWAGEDEIEKLLRHGEGWLSRHPERELITRRYLKHKRLVQAALAQLVEEDGPDPDAVEEAHAQEEAEIEQTLSLHEQRLGAVLAVLKNAGAHRVLDLGCGEGRLLKLLLAEKSFTDIVGMDVSYRTLEIAKERLHLEGLPPAQRQRIQLIQGALTYRDRRLSGYDAAAVVEVIEHLDQSRLASFERVVFEFAQPELVVCTTPNVEYNVKFTGLPAGRLRHKDHRFEWTRAEFQSWANNVAERFGYKVRFLPIGPEDVKVGAPSQMGIFIR